MRSRVSCNIALRSLSSSIQTSVSTWKFREVYDSTCSVCRASTPSTTSCRLISDLSDLWLISVLLSTKVKRQCFSIQYFLILKVFAILKCFSLSIFHNQLCSILPKKPCNYAIETITEYHYCNIEYIDRKDNKTIFYNHKDYLTKTLPNYFCRQTHEFHTCLFGFPHYFHRCAT